MPRRARIDSASNMSSELSSASRTPPTDASGEPLPVPTTLGSHVIGPRLLRSASRSSWASSSALTSRSSSIVRQVNVTDSDDPGPPASASISRTAPTTTGVNDEPQITRRPSRGGLYQRAIDALSNLSNVIPSRRRKYSIRDEEDNERRTSNQSSSSSSFTSTLGSSVIPEIPPRHSSPKGKRRTAANENDRGRKRRKGNDSRAIDVGREAGPSTSATSSGKTTELDVEVIRLPGEDKHEEVTVYNVESSSPVTATRVAPSAPSVPTSEPLAEYSCPICFSPPTNATITPCGHICCGECLFTAVRSSLQRAPMPLREPNVARCPVCRAVLNGWDGRGGGVIGLKPRTIISL